MADGHSVKYIPADQKAGELDSLGGSNWNRLAVVGGGFAWRYRHRWSLAAMAARSSGGGAWWWWSVAKIPSTSSARA